MLEHLYVAGGGFYSCATKSIEIASYVFVVVVAATSRGKDAINFI